MREYDDDKIEYCDIMENIVKSFHEVPLIQRKGADRYDEK